jgi:hypothetical protein
MVPIICISMLQGLSYRFGYVMLGENLKKGAAS